MRIDEEKRVLKGEHNGRKFEWHEGVLHYLGDRWGQDKVKGLVDLCNILKLQGYDLVPETPKQRSGSNIMFSSLWGQPDEGE